MFVAHDNRCVSHARLQMLYARSQLDMEDFYRVLYVLITALLGAFGLLKCIDGKFNKINISWRRRGYFRCRRGVSRRDVAFGEFGNKIVLQVDEVERRLAAIGKTSSRPNHQH